MPFSWTGNRSIKSLAGDLERYQRGAIGRTVITANRYAEIAESHMKATAPWTNRTGDARRGLWAKAHYNAQERVVTIGMGYDVYYGVFLEEAHGMRFAIVGPTRAWLIPQLWAALERMMRAAP